MAVWALIGDGAAAAVGLAGRKPGTAAPLAGGVVFVDPRLATGLRALLPAQTGEASLRMFGLPPPMSLLTRRCAFRSADPTAVATSWSRNRCCWSGLR